LAFVPTQQISLKKMREFADALGREMCDLATVNTKLVASLQPDGGFYLRTAPESDNVMRARFNGFIVAVTHEWGGLERLVPVVYALEGGQVVAYLLAQHEPKPLASRDMAEALLKRFVDTCRRRAPARSAFN